MIRLGGGLRQSLVDLEEVMKEIMDRITVDPEQCGGRPCIRGMRIRVTDVLDLLAAGLSISEILEEMPALEREDIEAALRFSSRRLDHPILAA
jgi:uncharacterized protein (DUF433 family)